MNTRCRSSSPKTSLPLYPRKRMQGQKRNTNAKQRRHDQQSTTVADSHAEKKRALAGKSRSTFSQHTLTSMRASDTSYTPALPPLTMHLSLLSLDSKQTNRRAANELGPDPRTHSLGSRWLQEPHKLSEKVKLAMWERNGFVCFFVAGEREQETCTVCY